MGIQLFSSWPTLAGGARSLRHATTAAFLASAFALAGCGGGGSADVAIGVSTPVPVVQIGVVGAAASYAPVESGEVLDVVANVGQPVTFDANEPVAWSFSVNGSPLFASGSTVDIGGVQVQQVQVDPTRAVLGSFLYGPAILPVDVLLTATSTIDAAQVATIRLHLQ